MTIQDIIKNLSTYSTDLDAVPNSAATERNFRIALVEAINILKRLDNMIDDRK